MRSGTPSWEFSVWLTTLPSKTQRVQEQLNLPWDSFWKIDWETESDFLFWNMDCMHTV